MIQNRQWRFALVLILIGISMSYSLQRYYSEGERFGTVDRVSFYVMVGVLPALATILGIREWWQWLKDPLRVCPLCKASLKRKGYELKFESSDQAIVLCKACNRKYEVRRTQEIGGARNGNA